MLAAWYQRNLRIVHNLIRLSRPGHERILLLIGNGHTGVAHLFEPYAAILPGFRPRRHVTADPPERGLTTGRSRGG